MADYWEFHATADLDAYVTSALEAKAAGLPGRRRPRGRLLPRAAWTTVAGLLDGYPFDVLLGSVHWVGRLALRRPRRPGLHGRVVGPRGRRLLGRLHRGHRGAGGLAGLRRAGPPRPDQGGRATCPTRPEEWWDRIAEAAAASGMAAELSSAGWRKPVGEQYPARPLLRALRRPRGAAHHGVGRPPPRAGGRPGRRPAGRAGGGRASTACRPTGGRRRRTGRRPAPGGRRVGSRWPPRPSWPSSTPTSSPTSSSTSSACSARGRCWPTSPSPTCCSSSRSRRRTRSRRRRASPSWWCWARSGRTTAPPWSSRTWSARRSPSRVDASARASHTGEIVRGSIHHPILGEPVPVENIPVRFGGR